jgi:hypothetical protein
MVMHQREGAPGEEVSRSIDISHVLGAEGERGVCEAVGREVWDCCSQDGRFSSVEGAGWRRMVVGMIESRRRWIFAGF